MNDDEYKHQLDLLNSISRNTRQHVVAGWCRRSFGYGTTGYNAAEQAEERNLRFLEEAIELFQACGGDKEMAHKLVDVIFEKPVGNLEQEFGGVGVTLLALANSVSVSADDSEKNELARVLSKPPEYWAARNQRKNEIGLGVKSIRHGGND